MKINAKIILTEEELMDAITKAVNAEFRYTDQLPTGEAIDMVGMVDGTWVIEWGQRPVPVEPTPEACECKPSPCS